MNAWVQHVKQYAADNNLSYACALSTPNCRETYHPPVNYTPQLKRISTMLRNKRGQPLTAEKIQQARDAFNQVRVLINALPAGDTKKRYMDTLTAMRNRIRSLISE